MMCINIIFNLLTASIILSKLYVDSVKKCMITSLFSSNLPSKWQFISQIEAKLLYLKITYLEQLNIKYHIFWLFHHLKKHE